MQPPLLVLCNLYNAALHGKDAKHSSIPAKPHSHHRINGFAGESERLESLDGPGWSSRQTAPQCCAAVTDSSHRGSRPPAFPSPLPLIIQNLPVTDEKEVQHQNVPLPSLHLAGISLQVATSCALLVQYRPNNAQVFLDQDDSYLRIELPTASSPFSLSSRALPTTSGVPLLPFRPHCCATVEAAVYHPRTAACVCLLG